MDDQAMPADTSASSPWLSPRIYTAAMSFDAPLPDVGAPRADLLRSPAALRVAELAVDSGLRLFNYESRVELEWPESWLPADRPDLGVDGLPPAWHRGTLPEPKYASFRHDLLLGSLHPGQRSKWTAHELCHGLVGFAWREDASTLFHGLAARLAEVVPVALWYFLDEAWLRRCERHADQGIPGAAWCPRCERAAAQGWLEDDPMGEARLLEGMAFIEREIAATLESAQTGRPVFTPTGHIDLMSDGLAYAAAHGPRLRSPEFQSWIARFASQRGETGGWFSTLEGLADRALSVARAIVFGEPLPPLTYTHKAHLPLSDIGWRLLQISADTDGECYVELDRLIQIAAEGCTAASPEAPLRAVIAGYEALHAEYELPDPAETFALGLSLLDSGDFGHGHAQLRAGLESVCGRSIALLGDAADPLIARFAVAEAASRALLGRRFAAFVATDEVNEVAEAGQAVADVARLEAAIAHVEPPDTVELSLGWDGASPDGLRLAQGVELVEASRDVAGIVMHGDPPGEARAGQMAWLVRRDAEDQVGLTALSPATAALIRSGFSLDAEDEAAVDGQAQYELNLLAEEGFIVPDRWELALPHEARAPQH